MCFASPHVEQQCLVETLDVVVPDAVRMLSDRPDEYDVVHERAAIVGLWRDVDGPHSPAVDVHPADRGWTQSRACRLVRLLPRLRSARGRARLRLVGDGFPPLDFPESTEETRTRRWLSLRPGESSLGGDMRVTGFARVELRSVYPAPNFLARKNLEHLAEGDEDGHYVMADASGRE
jgi:hypothetical protein